MHKYCAFPPLAQLMGDWVMEMGNGLFKRGIR